MGFSKSALSILSSSFLDLLTGEIESFSWSTGNEPLAERFCSFKKLESIAGSSFTLKPGDSSLLVIILLCSSAVTEFWRIVHSSLIAVESLENNA